VSCALTGTHDTETLAEWWDAAAPNERAALLRLPLLRDRGIDPAQPWSPAIGDVLLELGWTAASELLFITAQDVFGWRDRVNLPGTVGDHNWSWRLPWPVDHLLDLPEARDRAAFCLDLSRRHRNARVQSGV
jgi:4-alpha-glucanotransferase